MLAQKQGAYFRYTSVVIYIRLGMLTVFVNILTRARRGTTLLPNDNDKTHHLNPLSDAITTGTLQLLYAVSVSPLQTDNFSSQVQ